MLNSQVQSVHVSPSRILKACVFLFPRIDRTSPLAHRGCTPSHSHTQPNPSPAQPQNPNHKRRAVGMLLTGCAVKIAISKRSQERK
jgi:hypothetical protein